MLTRPEPHTAPQTPCTTKNYTNETTANTELTADTEQYSVNDSCRLGASQHLSQSNIMLVFNKVVCFFQHAPGRQENPPLQSGTAQLA